MVILDTTTPANNFQGDPNTKLTYSAPSTKWILGSNGLYQSGTTLRTEYDTSGVPLGWLIEEARTNLILQNQSFDNASWTKANSSITANTVTSPDGTANADKLVEDSTVGVAHSVEQGFAKAASAIAYNTSVYAKSAGRTWLQIAVYDGAATGNRYWFNLGTGVLGSTAAIGAGFTSTSATITNVGNGWYRCSVQATSNTATNLTAVLYSTTGDTITSYNGDGSSGVYLWGAQVEAGTFPTSPIVTTTATVTRAVDSISILTSALPWAGSASGSLHTLYVSGQRNASVGNNWGANFPPASGQFDLVSGDTNLNGRFGDQNNLVAGQITTTYKAALACTNTVGQTYDISKNGSAVQASAALASIIGAVTTFYVANAPGQATNQWTKQIAYFPRRFTGPQLQTLTT
jgi:hypothetical protein